ncbi:pyridine nucleotide-disulfide oxidoreductase [Sporanaerobium hydrogeniformans]|uniref:Pyridine nucleotide-disulfide oxidoreductase n=1 Tax=Sporanaerobium hydrogeniformans TaxID=3072179 RepID=A0AC61DFW0_9FIRM|nr:FAD-dependent oxidoreductase [Sporanaerobium hydrogeniformans]PHV71898.1 pyridine nucleotide-disulfide oxidoreductase [Sporanaerobium hydrogeniformans]
MKTYIEQQKILPICATVDVLILGGGPAGFAAAVCAAREGAHTLLVEQTGDVGGVATTGLMSHWTGKTEGGFYEEILQRTSNTYVKDERDYKIFIDHETCKIKMLEMLEEAGAHLRLYSFASDVIVEDNEVKGVIIESKSGREVILAKVVIDATGDGDIAYKAGVPYFKGREKDGLMQPMTLMFQVAGVDRSKIQYVEFFEDTYEVPEGDIQQLARQYIPSPAGHVLIYPSVYPNVVTLNMTNCIGVDGTNAEDLTKAHVLCRKQLPLILKFLKEHVPGFEEAYIIKSASVIGVRETRHFLGERTLTEKDILEARVHEDWAVTKAQFNFDVHNLTGNGLDQTGAQHEFKQTKGYTIPYGCFIPKEIDNLMLAGRNISGTHMAHSNYRVMPICANMGQSVGVAAAMCTKDNIKPRHLDIKTLQAKLKELGVTP